MRLPGDRIAEKPNGVVKQLPPAGSPCHPRGGGGRKRGGSLEPRSQGHPVELAHEELVLWEADHNHRAHHLRGGAAGAFHVAFCQCCPIAKPRWKEAWEVQFLLRATESGRSQNKVGWVVRPALWSSGTSALLVCIQVEIQMQD